MTKAKAKSKATTKRGGIGTALSAAARAVPPGGPGTSVRPAGKATKKGGGPGHTFIFDQKHLAEGGSGTTKTFTTPTKPVSRISIHKDSNGKVHLDLFNK